MYSIVLSDGRGQLYQWDIGRYVKLVGFASCAAVNFFDPSSDEAFVVKTETRDGAICAPIPNQVLEHDRKVKVYAVGADADGKYIECATVIPLIPRQKPADYVYEPTEVMTFESVLADAQASADAASKSASDAATSKKNASDSASNALTSEQNASKSASNAKTSENNATAQRRLAERYAVGTEDGIEVTSGVGYENNAKFWAAQGAAVSLRLFLDDEDYLCME